MGTNRSIGLKCGLTNVSSFTVSSGAQGMTAKMLVKMSGQTESAAI